MLQTEKRKKKVKAYHKENNMDYTDATSHYPKQQFSCSLSASFFCINFKNKSQCRGLWQPYRHETQVILKNNNVHRSMSNGYFWIKVCSLLTNKMLRWSFLSVSDEVDFRLFREVLAENCQQGKEKPFLAPAMSLGAVVRDNAVTKHVSSHDTSPFSTPHPPPFP